MNTPDRAEGLVVEKALTCGSVMVFFRVPFNCFDAGSRRRCSRCLQQVRAQDGGCKGQQPRI